MSFVTIEGQRAHEAFLSRVDNLREPVLNWITRHQPVTAGALLETFPHETERTVREAMWCLLDEHSIGIDANRKLVAA